MQLVRMEEYIKKDMVFLLRYLLQYLRGMLLQMNKIFIQIQRISEPLK